MQPMPLMADCFAEGADESSQSLVQQEQRLKTECAEMQSQAMQ
jgi:hypothetical protein